MSYRNPQIIIDRSGEIWGQAIAGFGANVAKGIDVYNKRKQAAFEKSEKRREATQLTANGVSQNFMESINKVSGGIKDSSVSEQFKSSAINMAEIGEEITVNGKSFTMGAIQAQTELKMNPNLDKDTRTAYSQIVANFKGYQENMLKSGANIIAGLEPLEESTTGELGETVDFYGERYKNTESQMVSYSLLNKKISGVKSKKELKRVKGEDGIYRNILNITSRVDVNSETYKNWKDADLINNDDGTLGFTVDPDDPNFVISTWERDLDKWSEEGDLIVQIAPNVETTESMKMAGFIDDKGTATGKGFNKDLVYTSRGVKGGVERKSEQHFDPDALRYNKTYEAELKGSAANILALPDDQQMKYIGNTLGWSDIREDKWVGATQKVKEGFLMEQMFEQDLRKIMGAGKGMVQTRDATKEDVSAYKAMGIDIKLTDSKGVPTTLYYTTKGTKVTPYEKKTGTSPSALPKKAYEEYNKNLAAVADDLINSSGSTYENGILTIPAGEDEDGDTIPEEKINMRNESEALRFYNKVADKNKLFGGSEKDKERRLEWTKLIREGVKSQNSPVIDKDKVAALRKKYGN